MSSHARYGTGGTSRKKVCVTYTIRDEKEPLNRSGVNRLRVDNCSSLSRDLVLTAGRDSIIRAWDLKELNETNGQAVRQKDIVIDMYVCNTFLINYRSAV